MPLRAASTLRFLVAASAGIAATPWTTLASACGPLPPTLVGKPGDQNTGVPTDAVPFYYEYPASIDFSRLPAARFVLTSSTGEVIQTTPIHRQNRTFELTPEKSLSPRTKYTLHGTWAVAPSMWSPNGTADRSLEFTSGAGPYGTMPTAPVAGVQHYLLHELDGTVTGAGSCIFYSSDLPVEATLFGSEEVDAGADYGPSLEFGSFFQNISGIMQNTEHDCVRLRLRAPNGTLSAPTVVCRKDGPLLMLTVNDELLCRSYGIRPMPMPDAGAKPPTDVTTEPTSNATTDASTDREASADPSPDHGPDAAASCSVFGSRNGRQSSAWEMLTTLSVVAAWRARGRKTR